MSSYYRPINARNTLSIEQLRKSLEVFDKNYMLSEPGIHQCLNLDNYILLKSSVEINSDTIVTVKNPRKFKDISKEFPKEFQTSIKEIKKKLKLNNDTIRGFKKELKKVEFQKLDIEKQLKHIESLAELSKQRLDLENSYRNFIKNYEALNESVFRN